MTTQELYAVVGGDYEKMKENVRTEERIIKFAKLFLEEGTFSELKSAMEKKDYEEAFLAAHKLKGICQNMYFARMFRVVFDLTEDLRNKANIPEAQEKMVTLEEIYNLTTESIIQLD